MIAQNQYDPDSEHTEVVTNPDFEWLVEQYPEIYARLQGQWIAVFDKRIVAEGHDFHEVSRSADRVAPPDRVLIMQVLDYAEAWW